MKAMFYPKFALNSIKKNKSLYIPYILTSVLWIMMFYIIMSLSTSPFLSNIIMGSGVVMVLSMAVPVILLFSFFFLIYTNSFLIKQRNKEYALYNILGMNRKNITRILCWDTAIVAGISIIAGLAMGILLYKMAELGLINIIQTEINYSFDINVGSVLKTIVFYSIIFILILIKSIVKINITNPIELLKSENMGEKPPKANWIFGIFGALCLIVAYYIALTQKNPMSSIQMFFIAVALVIIGTFSLFEYGSVILCKLLQKNKKYYYKANHFISVSSMAYRMRRNGSGLATICILSTMVLVMISSSTCLYIGNEELIHKRYPKDVNLEIRFSDIDSIDNKFTEKLRGIIIKETEKSGGTVTEEMNYKKLIFTAVQSDNNFKLTEHFNTLENLYQLICVDINDYNRIMSKDIKLGENEVLINTPRTTLDFDEIMINNEFKLKVKSYTDEIWSEGSSAMTIFPSIIIVTNDLNKINNYLLKQNTYSDISYVYNFNDGLELQQEIQLRDNLYGVLKSLRQEQTNIPSYLLNIKSIDRKDFYALYGGLFFIGIILSILFVSAAVLIIYYKQIVEGYEDKDKFIIMQKVGMTKKEIQKNVNSQMLTVFFFPLIMAGVHLLFAFPIIKVLLSLFDLTNTALFMTTTIVSFLVFAVFYIIIYKITTKLYLKIVSLN